MQGNMNKMSLQMIDSLPPLNDQVEIFEEQNNESLDGQDYVTEVLNISKIKEGFYIGDKIAAISIEVVVQFKLTHMINASGNQIINQWETIGMKYLTLNWSESPNQILFDPNDEIADKILFFIDDSCINGEGLLAHSFKGQDRVCIVVLIYLMKKYRWSLKKSMEYLKSKKQDVDIPPFFLSQLIKFESRLIQRGELTKDIPWSFENLKDPEEKLLRNTYMNGINVINRQNINDKFMNNKSNLRHIIWADTNPNQQIPISIVNLDKDLFFKQNIRPIYPHQQKRPLKPCIKSNKVNKKYIIQQSKEENEEKEKRSNNSINIKKSNLINSNANNLKFVGIQTNTRKIPNTENQNDENINYTNIPNNKNNKNEIIKNIQMKNGLINNNIIQNRNGIINNNYLASNNKIINLMNNNQIKKCLKRNISDNNDYQVNPKQNQNNSYNNNNNYNLKNEEEYNYIENVEPKLEIKNNFKNINNKNEKMNKFGQKEMLNYKIYEDKENKMNNFQINKKEKNSYPQKGNNPNEENIIIIANKYDNIIKNNINNYYINQIGAINNKTNNVENNNMKNNNFVYEEDDINLKKHNKKNSKKSIKNEVKRNSKDKSIKKQNDFEEIPLDINIKEFNNGLFNNSKVLRNNFKNILGSNHRQILGINNDNNNNFFFISQNFNTSNSNSESEKNNKNVKNNTNEKRFKLIENCINNYNRNNITAKFNIINSNKENKSNNYNILNESKIKSFDYLNNPRKQFLGRASPKIVDRENNNIRNDPIISNYNPIKKNKQNNRPMSSNAKNKNYQGNESYQNKNLYNINVNNYNISSNKPVNNFNPHLIKRKGTPTSGHQSIKVNNVNNNPVKIKNDIIIKSKKPLTPDMIINKSSSLVSNNSSLGQKINSTNTLFRSSILNNNSFQLNKTKKVKNYEYIQRPSTAPHKDKTAKDKRGIPIMNIIQDSKKSINNYNKNVHKVNQRPSSAGQGKNYHKNEYNKPGISVSNFSKKMEIELGNKYINSISKKRMVSPQMPSNKKIGLGNSINSPKFNIAKYRVPSPLIKSTSLGEKTFMNSKKNNMNFYMNKSASFNIK